MNQWPEGRAIVYCEGNFASPNGKTAHGLARRSERFDVVAIVDSTLAGRDAREYLDGRPAGVPLVADLEAALAVAGEEGASHFVIGLAPDGGRLPEHGRRAVGQALEAGLHVVSGLHDFLSDDPDLAALAASRGVTIKDVRKPPDRDELHFFSGKIEEVEAFTIALLGTDSAVGKRTTAWLLIDGLRAAGVSAELIGTGQTAWMQGARYSIVLDSLVNDFVAGEIEHAVWSAWSEQRPRVIVLEGQGSLLNPAYPGGFELLAAGRPDAIVLQHAPARKDYDGFPGYPLHPLGRQLEALRVLSDAPVLAVTLNHEGLDADGTASALAAIEAETGLPAFDALRDGVDGLLTVALDALAKAKS